MREQFNQVKDESLMNLANEFKKIKTRSKGQSYADKIAYKEYETSEDGEPKPVSTS